MENVAVVVLDTLRKDAFDRHFDWLPGKRFENTWSPSHWTIPVHAAMFTGRYPSELGVYAGSERLDCPDTVLAEHLSELGYRTRGFSTNGNVSSHFDYDRGFDEFDVNWRAEGWQEELELTDESNVFDWKRFASDSAYPRGVHQLVGAAKSIFGPYNTSSSLRHGWGRLMRGPGSPGFDEAYKDFGATEALEWVRSRDFDAEGEFLFVNLMEAHNPYTPPEGYQTVEPVRIEGLLATAESPSADPDRIRQAYDDSVRYLSDRYEAIFEELHEDFDYIITLSDHGELLGEHDSWEHLCGLYPELVHVPLVITGAEDGVDDKMVSLLDIFNTVLELAGADEPASSRGGGLLAEQGSRPTIAEYHGLSPLHLRSLSADERDFVDYLDVELRAITAPPNYYGYETPDGFKDQGTAHDENPLQVLEDIADSLEVRTGNQEDYEEMSDEVLERLEELGYA
jgi:arylsulfatase A-like enzyme